MEMFLRAKKLAMCRNKKISYISPSIIIQHKNSPPKYLHQQNSIIFSTSPEDYIPLVQITHNTYSHP